MNTNLTLMAVGLALTFTSGLAAAGVISAARPPLPQTTVSFGDLNLKSAEGAERLYRRIKVAAEKVCEQPGEPRLAQQARRQACVDQAIEHAVANIEAPLLTRYYQAKTGKAVHDPVVAKKD